MNREAGTQRLMRVGVAARIAFGVLIFVALFAAIASGPTKRLNDFDQSFYLTIAYDLDRHGVFSNGIFDAVDSTAGVPPPGMFFAPVYPWLVLAATKVDGRFAGAFLCAIESNHGKRDSATCDIYALPIHVMHALFLTLGVLAIALAAEFILATSLAFFVGGALAAAGLALEAELFSYIMTESVTFSLYSVLTLAILTALKRGRCRYFAATGVALGLLCLTRPSYLVLIPTIPLLLVLARRWVTQGHRQRLASQLAVFALALAIVVFPWLARNAISVGQFRFTEEYGSATLVERFAYNTMTAREFFLAFPYCVPAVGPPLVNAMPGADAMARFQWDQPGGFFSSGRARRMALVEKHGKLDPVIGELFRAEMRENWWRHLLVSIPLGWCGMWVAGFWSLLLIPLFLLACVEAVRRAQPLLLFYAVPAVVMIGLHAGVANHYSRYNLGLMGPIVVGATQVGLKLRRARSAKAVAE